MYQGVYLYGHTAPPHLAWETAALLVTGATGHLSHETVLHLDGLLTRPECIHVTVPGRQLRRRARLHPHRGVLPPHETRVLNPCARRPPPARFATSRRPWAHASSSGSRTKPRSAAWFPAALVPASRSRSSSDASSSSCGERGFSPTATNVRIAGYEVDVLFADQHLIVELDGWQYHRSRRAFERDRAKQADLVAAGYRVMRITWRQVTERPEELLVRLARALNVGGPPGGDPPTQRNA